MSRSRSNFKLVSNKKTAAAVIIFLISVLSVAAICAAGLYGIGAPDVPGAYAADGGTISAPQFGMNYFQTTDQSVTATSTDSADFTIELPTGNNNYNSVTNGYYSNYAASGYEVAYAVYNPDITVLFTFNFTLSADASVTIAYYNASGNVAVENGVPVQSVGEYGEGNQSVAFTLTYSTLNTGDYIRMSVTPRGVSSATVSSARVTISSLVDASFASVVGNSISMTVSGTNRETVSYANINYGNIRTQINNTLFVKPGDTVSLSLTLTYSADQTPVDFHHSFTAAFGYFGSNSCVYWDTFANDRYNSDATYLRFSAGQTFYKGTESMTSQNNVYFGYTVSFEVLPGAGNANVLNIVPLFPMGIDENGDVMYFNSGDLTNTSSSNYISLRVDADSPNAPVVSTASAFGEAIRTGSWYTESQSVVLNYQNAAFDATLAQYDRAAEQVYAFIVPANISAGAIASSNYDFTPSNNPSDTAHNLSYSMGGASGTATRQQLGYYTETTQNGKNALTFGEPGTWGLVLFAVDSAGNVSASTLYSGTNAASDRRAINIDATRRNVYAVFDTPAGQFEPGSTTSAYNNYIRYANVYIFAGSNYHDQNGVCNVPAGIPTADFSADRRAYSTVRVNYITMRVIMRPEQYDYYEITGYTIQGGTGSYNISLSTFTSGGTVYRYLDITLSVTDTWWSDSSEFDRPVMIYFRQRVSIVPNTTVYTYTSRPITFDTDDSTVTTADTGSRLDGDRPSLGIQYYDEITLVYYSNASAGSITTGGRVELEDGTVILTVPSGTSMNDYVTLGTIITHGDSEYYVYETAGSWTTITGNDALATRTVYALDLSAASSTGFIDAGNYFYRIYVNASAESDYYGESIGRFTIEKAAPLLNGVQVSGSIEYLQSLDAVEFLSMTQAGEPITSEGLYNIGGTNYRGAVTIGGTDYYLTAGGVYGTYNIVTPASGTSDYLNPQGGSVDITVEFVPIDLTLFSNATIAEYYSDFFSYFFTESGTGANVTYELRSGGRHYGNYSSVRYNLTVTVDPKTIIPVADASAAAEAGGEYIPGEDEAPGTFVYMYDGHPGPVYFTSYYYGADGERVDVPASEYVLVIEYKLRIEGDSSYTTTAPSIAGVYDVRITVDPGGGNYASDVYIYTMEITKQELNVTLSSASGDSGYEGEMNVGGETYAVRGALEYVLGHLTTADYVARDSMGEEVYGLQYVYSVWKASRFGYDGGEVALDEAEFTDRLPIISSNAFGAGVYLMYAEIVNDNYSGGVYVRMTVAQGSPSNNLNVTIPSLLTPYTNVSPDGTTAGAGHMEFGETLAYATENIIGSGGIVRYASANGNSTVSGRFFFESEAEYALHAGDGYTASVNGTTVLDVIYNGNRVSAHSVRLFWQAGEYDSEGNFVPNYDYAEYAEPVSIYVVRAEADFSEVYLADTSLSDELTGGVPGLIYGQTVGEADFVGYVSAGGYVFAEGEYTLAFQTGESSRVPGGGYQTVNCMFIPGRDPETGITDEWFTRRYLTAANAEISVYVHQRNVTIDFTPTGDIAEGDLNEGDYDSETELAGAVYRTYGTRYQTPDVIVTPVSVVEGGVEDPVPGGSVVITFTYYIAKPEGYTGDGVVYEFDVDGDGINEEYLAADMAAATEVGRYYVLASVNTANYVGRAFRTYYVVKAELNYAQGTLPVMQTEYLSDIADVDFGSQALSHAPAGGVATTFIGSFRLYYVAEDGTEYDSYSALEVNEDVSDDIPNVYIGFVPNEEYAASYALNFRPFEREYRLVVARRDISGSVSIAADADNDSVVTLSFDDRDKIGGALSAAASYSDPVRGDTFAAEFVYTVNGVSGASASDAGKYEVVASIAANDRFVGSVTVTLIIEPAGVRVDQFVPASGDEYAVLESVYGGSAYSFVPVFSFTGDVITGVDTSNFEYSLRYSYHTGVPMGSAPVNIGRYILTLTLNENNYAIDGLSAAFVQIVPDITGLGNASQTYAPPDTTMRISAVYPVYREGVSHPSPTYIAYYETDGSFVTELPVDAGEYAVRLVYSDNGLFDWTYEGTLVIAPYAVEFSFPEGGYSYEYTGSPISLASGISLPHGITAASFTYNGSSEAPTDAGVYDVAIEITDPNYSGTGNTVMTVTAAEVRIVTSIGTVDIPFNTSVEDVNAIFAERLSNITVIFPNTGAAVAGVFTLADGADVSGYSVGSYNVDITFRPTSANFAEITQTIGMNISKKDIGAYIEINAEIAEDEFGYYIEREYAGSAISLSASVGSAGETVIMPGYGAISVTVLYDNSSVAPLEVGEYRLRAEINDPNYYGVYDGVVVQNEETGETVTKELILRIVKCTPRLDLSNVRFVYDEGAGEVVSATYPIGIPFTADNIYANSIFAYMGQSSTTVSGSWALDDDDGSVTFSSANENAVGIWFLPSDQERYVSVYATLTVMVSGENVADLQQSIVVSYPDEADSAVYGTTLGEIGISLQKESQAASIGSIAWAESADYVPGVGEYVEYVFTPNPDNYSDYNVVRGTLVLNITRAEMKVEAFAYIFTGNEFTTDNVHVVFRATDASKKVLDGVEYRIKQLVGNADGAAAGFYIQNASAEVEFTHPNYGLAGSAVRSLSIFVYTEVTQIDHSSGKYYDGHAVDTDALGLRSIGTEYELDGNDFRLVSLLKDGVEIDPDLGNVYAAGVYTITVQIFEENKISENGLYHTGRYYGVFTFDYTVEKFDVGESINVTGNRKTYAQDTPLVVTVEGYEELIDSSEISVTYLSYDRTTSYGALQPAGAGSYWVVVSVTGSDFYTGTREFEYIIDKREATVTFIYPSGGQYVFEYSASGGYEEMIRVSLSNNLTSADYRLYYVDPATGTDYDAGYFPGNIGTYYVVVEITHANYTGTLSAPVTIVAASVTVESPPSLSQITYGANLGSAVVTGGVALSGSREVSGTFTFADPSAVPDAGRHSVTMIFVPSSSNYSSAQCLASVTVNPSPVNLEFVSSVLTYNGEHQIPALNSTLSFRYSLTDSSGATVYRAVNAGVYGISIEITDPNYIGSMSAMFTINRAQLSVDDSVMPVPSAVRYGAALSTGTFSGGSMVYVPSVGAVSGTYSYASPSMVLGNVGEYASIPFVFTPNDTLNYESYTGTLTVTVIKAVATIYVTGNTTFTYGNDITAPVFTTSPQNMTVINDSDFIDFAGSDPAVGTYTFTAEISDNNYEGEISYVVTITKRPLRLSYYMIHEGTMSITETYTYYYGSTSPVVPRLRTEDIIAADADRYTALQSRILVYYYAAGADTSVTTSGSISVPRAVGDYVAVATMDDANYYIDTEYASVSYIIRRGTVSSITFDYTSLSTQVYGSVTMPTVVTNPAGVNVVIRFEGYDENVMPTSAGEYTVTAEVVDDNYMPTTQRATFRILPKEISIESLRAYGKSYDGLQDIAVTGELGGVLVGDEVTLNLTARTADGSTEIGTHSVILTSWSLSGLHAGNYTLRDPVYALSATISANVITDPATDSYISSEGGFSTNITVSFSDVYDTVNATNIFTRLFGQKATVQVIEIKENGLNTVLKDRVKFYVRIPDEYLGSKNLVVEGLGNLAEVTGFTREGDYITFYANSSGEIVFYTNDFPYWVIIVLAVVIIIILGLVVVLIAAPIRKRKRVQKGARKIYEWRENSGSVEEAYRRKVKAQIEERKRKWRY